MCLENIKRLEQPTNDIKCYKVLQVDGMWLFRTLWSPIMYYKWKQGKVYATGRNEPIIEPDLRAGKPEWGVVNRVEGGSFHTYADRDAAIRICNEFNKYELSKEPSVFRRFRYAVYECVIPADSNFVYEGTYTCFSGGKEDKCFASEKLRIGKCIYRNYKNKGVE